MPARAEEGQPGFAAQPDDPGRADNRGFRRDFAHGLRAHRGGLWRSTGCAGILPGVQAGPQLVNLALLLLDALLKLAVLVDDVPHFVLRGRAGENHTAGLGENKTRTNEAEQES